MALMAPHLVAQTSSSEEIKELETFEVTGFRESWIRSMQKERNSSNLKSVVSADSVGKLPDTNIAEALNRVSSIYLREDQGEGRYVSIRGIDPILNNVTINGQTVAVSDTDGRSGRAAPLDVLSASSIDSIEVIKAVTPDMDGQAIGGTININTPTGFSRGGESFTYGGVSVGYNDQMDGGDLYNANWNTGFTFGERREWAFFFGANYMKRDYLSYLNEGTDNVLLGDFGGEGDEYLSSNGETNEFGDVFIPERIKVGSADGSRERYGFTASLDFRPSERSAFHVRAYYTDYTDFEFRPEMEIRLRDLDETDGTRVTSADMGYGLRGRFANELRFEKQERPVYQFVIGGKQTLGEKWTVSGDLNITSAEENNPLLNYYEAETNARNRPDEVPGGAGNSQNAVMEWDNSNPSVPHIGAIIGNNANGESNWPNPGATPDQAAFHRLDRIRFITSEVKEETYSGDINLEYRGQWNDRPFRFKTGIKYLERDKSVDDTDNRYPWDGPDTFLNTETSAGPLARPHTQVVGDYPLGDPRSAPYIEPVPNVAAFEAFFEANRSDFDFDEDSSLANSVEDDFSLTEEILAYYAMVEFEPMDNLTVIAGARFEETEAELSAFTFTVLDDADQYPAGSVLPFTGDFGIAEVRGSQSYDNFLPNIQFAYQMADNWLLRGSFTSTLGRPDYPDTAPISTLEISQDEDDPTFFSGSLEIGNPNLEPYESDNWDLSLAYYFPGGEGMLKIGVFRKEIANAIYSFEEERRDTVYEAEGLSIPLDDLEIETFNNADDGQVDGIELEYRQNFSFLPEPFDGLGMLLNASFMESEVTIFQRPGETLPFFRQPDEVYNAQVYWAKGAWEARLAYSFLGSSLIDVGGNRFLDIYVAERELLDAQISYQVNSNWQVVLQADNITDEPESSYIFQPQFRAENPGYEIYGTTYRLGVNWEY